MRKLISFSLVAFIFIVLTSQTKKPSTNKIPLADSTAIISKIDIINFSQALKTGLTFDQYTKLTPENTLVALLNWKTDQLQKQLKDSTSKNK